MIFSNLSRTHFINQIDFAVFDDEYMIKNMQNNLIKVAKTIKKLLTKEC